MTRTDIEAALPIDVVLECFDRSRERARYEQYHYNHACAAAYRDELIQALERAGAVAALDAVVEPRLSPDDTLDVYVPGVWRCPRCDFQLVRQTMSVASGEIGVTRQQIEESEPCPNDGTPMIRLTWRERALDSEKRLVETMERLMRVTGTESWPRALDAIETARETALARMHPFDRDEVLRLRCECAGPDYHQTGSAACAISRVMEALSASCPDAPTRPSGGRARAGADRG